MMLRRVVVARVIVFAVAALAIIAGVYMERSDPSRDDAALMPVDSSMLPTTTATLQLPEPIAAEAAVFSARPGSFAVDPSTPRRAAAHPRTLAMYQSLRAYPGAPPRIPHGLTAEEYRTESCRTCHERGGYSQRFGAYAPITPHPEQSTCLQCHLPDATLVGVALPADNPNDVCRQCHTPGAPKQASQPAHWRSASWPQPATPSLSGAPPAIPHDVQMRGNCLTCHMGAGAVAEIRTTHPERANCMQCHVVASALDAPFTRPAPGAATSARGSK